MRERKVEKLAEQLHRYVAETILYELKDPRIGFITVGRVELSPDLSYGKVYISVLGQEKEKTRSMGVLERARGFIQCQVAHRLRTRNMPTLAFVLDESPERSVRMTKLLDEIAREREAKAAPGSSAEPEPDTEAGDEEAEPESPPAPG